MAILKGGPKDGGSIDVSGNPLGEDGSLAGLAVIIGTAPDGSQQFGKYFPTGRTGTGYFGEGKEPCEIHEFEFRGYVAGSDLEVVVSEESK